MSAAESRPKTGLSTGRSSPIISAKLLEFGLRLSDCSNRRTIWIVDAHRDDGKGYVVRADEKLTAFVELELAIQPL